MQCRRCCCRPQYNLPQPGKRRDRPENQPPISDLARRYRRPSDTYIPYRRPDSRQIHQFKEQSFAGGVSGCYSYSDAERDACCNADCDACSDIYCNAGRYTGRYRNCCAGGHNDAGGHRDTNPADGYCDAGSHRCADATDRYRDAGSHRDTDVRNTGTDIHSYAYSYANNDGYRYCYYDTNGHAYCYTYDNANNGTYGYRYCYTNYDAHGNTGSYAYCYANSHTYRDTHGHAFRQRIHRDTAGILHSELRRRPVVQRYIRVR